MNTKQTLAWLRGMGLADADATATPLTGGVSSDIWRVDTANGPICVKQALSKLKVDADWFAPTDRNAFEVSWFETVAAIAPKSVPQVLAHDANRGLFAMSYLDPATHPVWKAELAAGRADPTVAKAVGETLGRIHTATYHDDAVAAQFQTNEIFHAIRLEPYLLATAAVHPDLSDRLHELAAITAATRVALVHGDVSPKNILCGPDRPVFLDAECAWYGDPAFDVAFCLNHLLLKCLWNRTAWQGYESCFHALCHGYSEAVADDDILRRAAHLLPGLFLARIDGKSPVEYIIDEYDKNIVRTFAPPFLTSPAEHPIDICTAWHASLRQPA